MRKIINGEPFEVLSAGDGDATRTIWLLHGFPDTPRSFAPLASLLAAAGYRCQMPYLRGYAPSTLRGPFDADRLVDDLLALASDDGPVHLVGHDWGAVIAYAAAARAPSRFRSIVTMSVPHPRAFLENLRRHPSQLARSWYMLFFQLPWLPERVAAPLARRLWPIWSPGLPAPDDVIDTIARSVPGPLAYYRAMPRQLGRRDPPIAVPTRVLHGALDGCVAAELGEGQERFFRGPFSSEILPDVGHFLHVERPAIAAARILDCFTAYDGGSPP
jgi:pimeloyl-ACP methyl ester carboxylesterase